MLSGSQDIIPLLKPVSELKARYVVQRSPVDALIPRVALDPPHWSRRNLLLNIKVRSATAVNMTFGGDVLSMRLNFDRTTFQTKWVDLKGTLVDKADLLDETGKFRKDLQCYRSQVNIDLEAEGVVDRLLAMLTTEVLENTLCVFSVQGVPEVKSPVEELMTKIRSLGNLVEKRP